MELSLKDLKELLTVKKPKTDDSHYEIGKPYMVHTVTAFYKGILEKVTAKELILKNASWVPDTGRFNEFAKTGDSNTEEEPFLENTLVPVSRGAMVIAFQIPNLTRKLK